MKRLYCQGPASRFLSSALIVSVVFTAAGNVSAQTAYIATTPNRVAPNGVSVIDMASGKLTGKITVVGAASSTAVTPDGTKILVTDTIANAVSVIDIASRAVLARIPISYPGFVAVTPDGSKAYLTTGSR
jgi:YVTN family beta-propeller protein